MKKILVMLAVVAICGSIAMASYESGTCSSGSFTVNFSGANFVTGLGWSTGASRTITFSGSCSGCSVGPIIYGWGTNPLVEYYIGRGGGTSRGSYNTCKGTFTLYTNSCNGPNITGTGPFTQYNCSGSGSSGQCMGDHYNGWRNIGYGTTESGSYCVVMVEGWSSNSGSATVSVSSSNWYTHWVGSGSASFTCSAGSSTSTTTTAASTTTTTSSASTSTTTTSASTSTTTTSATTSTTSGGGCTCAVGCSSATTVTAPFTKDGVGDQCFVTTSIPNYVNSWNMAVLNINGADYTNKYVAAGSLPAKINGNYYIYYKGNYSWSHLEIR